MACVTTPQSSIVSMFTTESTEDTESLIRGVAAAGAMCINPRRPSAGIDWRLSENEAGSSIDNLCMYPAPSGRISLMIVLGVLCVLCG